MKLAYTRAMVRAIQDGSLAKVATSPDPVFGVQVPESCPDVPAEVLQPRATWEDREAYDVQAAKLARMFRENFQQFAGDVSEAVRGAGPGSE
jgi:phosphoenolpyruvate carboxykinase (ATP)